MSSTSGDSTGRSSLGDSTSGGVSITDESASSVDTTNGSSPSTTTDDGTSGTTTEPETCVTGSFAGLYTWTFKVEAFSSCESTDAVVLFLDEKYPTCPPETWIRIDGELCGPGPYGYLGGTAYKLVGTVVQGPCDATCEEDPAPESCTTFEQLCPFFECDPLWQDCPRGERCVPISSAGAPPWTETRCEPVLDPSIPIGGACTPTDPWQSECVAGAYCLAESSTCVSLCSPVADDCDTGSCWPCDIAGDPGWVGACNDTELAC